MQKETADRLEKEATQNHYLTYSRIPKSAIKRDPGRQYKKMAESMGGNQKRAITKDFFPSVERRLTVNLHLNTNVTTIMSGHGNIRSYLHRLKIIDSPECPCKQNIQTVDNLIF